MERVYLFSFWAISGVAAYNNHKLKKEATRDAPIDTELAESSHGQNSRFPDK